METSDGDQRVVGGGEMLSMQWGLLLESDLSSRVIEMVVGELEKERVGCKRTN